jgi:hypothetical protein
LSRENPRLFKALVVAVLVLAALAFQLYRDMTTTLRFEHAGVALDVPRRHVDHVGSDEAPPGYDSDEGVLWLTMPMSAVVEYARERGMRWEEGIEDLSVMLVVRTPEDAEAVARSRADEVWRRIKRLDGYRGANQWRDADTGYLVTEDPTSLYRDFDAVGDLATLDRTRIGADDEIAFSCSTGLAFSLCKTIAVFGPIEAEIRIEQKNVPHVATVRRFVGDALARWTPDRRER